MFGSSPSQQAPPPTCPTRGLSSPASRDRNAPRWGMTAPATELRRPCVALKGSAGPALPRLTPARPHSSRRGPAGLPAPPAVSARYSNSADSRFALPAFAGSGYAGDRSLLANATPLTPLQRPLPMVRRRFATVGWLARLAQPPCAQRLLPLGNSTTSVITPQTVPVRSSAAHLRCACSSLPATDCSPMFLRVLSRSQSSLNQR